MILCKDRSFMKISFTSNVNLPKLLYLISRCHFTSDTSWWYFPGNAFEGNEKGEYDHPVIKVFRIDQIECFRKAWQSVKYNLSFFNFI